MPAVQNTYLENQPAGVQGAKVDMIPATLISRTVEDAAGIAFGIAVARGVNDEGCSAFGVGDTAILGITLLDRSAGGPNSFLQYESARIMTKGSVWVTASVAVNDGDPVFVIPATGAFAKTNASSAVQIPNAVWDSTVAAPGLAKVRMG